MGLGSQGLRRARSLLHWKVDPEIFVLVGVVTCIGGIGLYTLHRKSTSGKNDNVIESGSVSDPDHITGYSKGEYVRAAEKKN
ncbi:hypothetical protein DSO57_1016777 [Entomophthora muscae]|uniref:Uncharacterized protein n=1 Tax=Entomophthora muscae TaxID=34485 RepID=A0ACC2U359_9FUNG|nr:hypothetical protein DSO57_1016777 [Entomophthora muscae]